MLNPVLMGGADTLFRYVAGDSLAAATFARGSTAKYLDVSSVLQSAASGIARDGHYIGGVRHLLLESQRTNLCLRSENFSNAVWAKDPTTTVTIDTDVAPDGATTADTLTATGGTGDTIRQQVTFTGDGTKVISLFVKQGTSSGTDIAVFDQTASAFRHKARISWSGGVPSLATVTGSGTLYSVTAVANSFYRIAISAASVVAANTNLFYIYPSPLTGTGTVIVWGAQAEDGAFATSYASTVAATVTRSADNLSAWGNGFVAQTTTLYEKYWDLATEAYVENLDTSSRSSVPTPSVNRAYTRLVLARGTKTLAQMQAVAG